MLMFKMHHTLTILLALVAVSGSLTVNEYRALRRVCDQRLLRGQGGNLPTLIRLAFHDCVGEGGCNGCLDHNHPENAGLEEINDAIVAVYNSDDVDGSLLSLADFIALCGVEAVERGYRDSYFGNSEFIFKTGRETVESCAGQNDDNFPSSLDGYTKTVTWLKAQFGLKDDREAIVLLGAHAMGNAERENSGHRGPWTRNPNVLDNEYYKVIINETWRQRDPGDGKYQWETLPAGAPQGPPPRPPPPGRKRKRDVAQTLIDLISKTNRREKRQAMMDRPLMMLNADISLYRSIDVNAAGVSQTCVNDVSNCGFSPGKETVEFLATDNDVFVEEFIVAFTKMIEKVPDGAPRLVAVGETPTTTTATAPGQGTTTSSTTDSSASTCITVQNTLFCLTLFLLFSNSYV